jgi:hypothetical protein
MSTLNMYRVEFSIVKAAAGGSSSAYQYRRPSRVALISAASMHPKDLLSVLNSDISVNAGEVIEILAASVVELGTEGQQALA